MIMTTLISWQSSTPRLKFLKGSWPRKGEWTYRDYSRLPEDGWIYEIIGGELYMSPAPRPRHQKCAFKFAMRLQEYADQLHAGEVYPSPVGVVLPGYADPVQPDVVFIARDRLEIVQEDRIVGAPHIVVEVLSPWNWKVDRLKKAKIYASAGVREFWLIDPDLRTMELFTLRDASYYLVGKYHVGDCVRSEAVPGFVVEVEEICPA
jgi:Uma2 family endonuclease